MASNARAENALGRSRYSAAYGAIFRTAEFLGRNTLVWRVGATPHVFGLLYLPPAALLSLGALVGGRITVMRPDSFLLFLFCLFLLFIYFSLAFFFT